MEAASGKSFGEITDADLANVTYIDWSEWSSRPVDARIADLTGIEFCRDLRALNLGDNMIADLSALGGVTTLEWLNVSMNYIDSLAPLLMLPNLAGIQVNSNPLTMDALSIITPVSFPNLTDIGLGGSDKHGVPLGISDADVVALLDPFGDLVALLLWDFPDMGDGGFDLLYDTVVAESASSLRHLQISGCGITSASLSAIADISGLEILALSGNDIADISALVTLGELDHLWLNGNQIESLAPLQTLHEAGGLAVWEGWDPPYLDVTQNGLDLTSGTPNRDVMDYLLANGVNVVWEPQD